ncbi:MAG: ribosomal protein L7/L12 [Ktedonobacteraceae bacterium]|nr:ribosomal protein L7/L12 [Ktedonobacteraceae bacterium]
MGNESLSIIIVTAGISIVVGFLLGRLSRGHPSIIEQQIANLNTYQPSHNELDEEPMDRIERLLREGNKIRAIKVYREHTGCGLKEAKEAVENLEGVLRRTDTPLANHRPHVTYQEDEQLRDQLITLVRQGNKLQAVKLYRLRSGLSLAETLKAIEALAQESNAVPGSSSPVDDEAWNSIITHLREGKKIQAIKLYREYTHSDLLDAKRAIDTLEAEMGNN